MNDKLDRTIDIVSKVLSDNKYNENNVYERTKKLQEKRLKRNLDKKN